MTIIKQYKKVADWVYPKGNEEKTFSVREVIMCRE